MVYPRISLVESFNPSSSNLKYSSSLNPYAFRFITFILLLMPSRVALVTCASYHAKIPVRFAISVLATFINGFSFVPLPSRTNSRAVSLPLLCFCSSRFGQCPPLGNTREKEACLSVGYCLTDASCLHRKHPCLL